MKIGKKSYLLIVVVLGLLLGSISFLGKSNTIKASSDDYKLEIVKVQEYNKLVTVKLSIAELSGQKLKLKAIGSEHLPVEGIFDEISDEDAERLTTKLTDDKDVIDIEFVDDGHSFSALITVPLDKTSEMKQGSISLVSESGNELAKTTFDIDNQIESKASEVDVVTETFDLTTFDLALPTPGVTEDVTTWAQFKAAMESTRIDWINVKNDLTADSDIGPVTISKVINGNDSATRRIDMRGYSVSLGAASAAQITITDIDLTGTSDNPMFSGINSTVTQNWVVAINNVNVPAGNMRPLAHVEQGGIIIAGNNNFESSGKVTTSFLMSKSFVVEDNSDITANMKTIFYKTDEDESSFTVTNSKMTIFIDAENAAVVFNGKTDVKFTGSMTDVSISSNLTAYAWSATNPDQVVGELGAVFVIADGVGGSKLTVDNQAKVTFESRASDAGASALHVYGGGSKIHVDNQAELNVIGEDANAVVNGGLFRYGAKSSSSGNHEIKVSNQAKLNVEKKGGATAAIRMYGNASNIIVESGADFILHHSGGDKAEDPGGNRRNQGIQYRNGTNGFTSGFTVTGENSNVSILADYGAAIDCNLQELNIKADEGTYFIVRGQTASSNKGVFSASANNLTFNMTKPKYFDFRNDRPSGGNIFEGAAGSTFNMLQSDLQVWDSGMNLDGNPSAAWNLIDSVWSGQNFANAPTTTATGLQGASSYSRMTANNQSPVIDELRVPTDADKYIWGHATVPEGKYDPIRAAYTGEVSVKVSVSGAGDPIGTVVEDPVGSGTVSVYGDDARTGIFKIPTSTGDFLVKGQQIKVEAAWRGAMTDENSSSVHKSDDADIQTPQRTVLDVTPPQPTQLTDENLNNATNILSGTGAEAGATVYIYYDTGDRTSPAGTLLGTTTVQADGTWSYQLAAYLTDAKSLSVYLGDDADYHTAAQVTSASGETPVLYDQTGLIKPPATNENGVGNINPYAADYPYHDAVFECVKKYVVADVLPNMPVMTKTVLSNNGGSASADAGDVLTYTLTAKNDKPASVTTTWKDVVVTDTLPSGLLFTTADAELKINGSPATYVTGTPGINEYSYDSGTRLLTVNLGSLNSTASAQITFKGTVSGSASGPIVNTATATGTSPRFEGGPAVAGEYEKVSESGTATISVAGTLSLVSVPKSIDFKLEEAKLNEDTKVIDPEITGDLVVSDNRVTRKSWTITAKLLTPMMPIDETDVRYVLPDAVRYNTGTEEKPITLDGTELISYTHGDAGEYNVSTRWSTTGEGFKFYASGGSVNKLGKYKAVLEFTLSNTPTGSIP